METISEKIFKLSAQYKSTILRIFFTSYIIISAIVVLAGYHIFNSKTVTWNYYAALILGKCSLVLFVLVLIPGIVGRLGVEIKITRILTLYRRQLGILMFLTAFAHYLLIAIFPVVAGYFQPIIPPPLFQAVGFYALLLTIPLFLTSNNFSVVKLGKNWKRLHNLIFVIMWLILFHIGLQRYSIWTMLLGITVILEVLSLIVFWSRKKSSPDQPNVNANT